MKNKSSGVPGIVVAVGLVILFLFSRRFFPSLSTILLVGFGIILALVVLIVVPIACAYPFFQRYFIQGMTIGSVKG